MVSGQYGELRTGVRWCRQSTGMSVVFPAKVLCKAVNAEPDSARENSADQTGKGDDAGDSEPWQVPPGVERRQ